MTAVAPSLSTDTSTWMSSPLADIDPVIQGILGAEHDRQQTTINLIASENLASAAVREATASVLTNKYAEGYPNRRYYGGCENADKVEALAIERVQSLFGCRYANVQPHAGSQANEGVFLALLEPGDVILGMDLSAGGHLTHGARVNLSGKWFEAVSYGVRRDDGRIDVDEVLQLARQSKPKLIIAGGSAYARQIDFMKFREIADEVGAYLLVDMAHFAGLVAGGAHPSPVPHAHVVTATTHKTLRGPRGGLIITDNEDIGKRISSAVFPGLQGGPLMHAIAAKAVAFGEALKPEFRVYANAVVENARTMAGVLQERGFDLVTGGTDTHLMLVDLRSKGLTGAAAATALEDVGIVCNKNAVPYDEEKPTVTSGIRIGTPTGTARGFGVAEFQLVGRLIADVLEALVAGWGESVAPAVRENVARLCDKFPIYARAE
ncbi:MAG: serine hydroxymethyltransferase [Alphaproteobacteria bacterium]|nr:serine hydroxymethyltransferase [Alphaproteobacteria bacterium]